MIRQRLEGIFARRLEDVLKTSWRRLENVLKTSWRGMVNTNILVFIKTSSEDEWLRRIYSSWWRRLQDVFWRRRRKKSSRRLQDVFIKTNVCWVHSKNYSHQKPIFTSERYCEALFIFLCNFFYTQSSFVFHVCESLYVVPNYILAFSSLEKF